MILTPSWLKSVGFYQEKQAADIVASLKGDIAMKTTVVRGGEEQVILARELVPGDIVRCSMRRRLCVDSLLTRL